MADRVSIVTSVAHILSTGINVCHTTTHLIGQIRDAPAHISAVASDLEAFNAVLSTIQTYIGDEDIRSGILHSSTSDDIRDVLKNIVSIFQCFHGLISDFISADGPDSAGTWQSLRWTWKEKEISQLHDQLSAYKMTLEVAIAGAKLITTTKTNATTAEVEQEAEDLRQSLAQLSTRLDIEDEWAAEDAIVRAGYETTLRRIANDAASVLSSVNPNEDPRLSVNIDRIVSTLANHSKMQETSSSQTREASYPSPDLEYTGSFYRLTLRFHGNPDQVRDIKAYFQQRAAKIASADLAVLCQNILQELTDQDSPGARMDFYFHQGMYDLPQLRDFLRDHVGFTLPEDYELGDFAALSPRWIFWLHSVAETTYSGVTKTSMTEDDSNHWRMTFMRRLDDLDTADSESQVILHRPQEKQKDARLPDVHGYSTYWKTLRDQFDSRKRDSPHSDDSPRALTSEA